MIWLKEKLLKCKNNPVIQAWIATWNVTKFKTIVILSIQLKVSYNLRKHYYGFDPKKIQEQKVNNYRTKHTQCISKPVTQSKRLINMRKKVKRKNIYCVCHIIFCNMTISDTNSSIFLRQICVRYFRKNIFITVKLSDMISTVVTSWFHCRRIFNHHLQCIDFNHEEAMSHLTGYSISLEEMEWISSAALAGNF